MNVEPLPGLLDDPQFQLSNLPALTDFHIAPLRNPAPSRHANAPFPLEPLTKPLDDPRQTAARQRRQQQDDETDKTIRRSTPQIIRPSDVLSAREAKKPHLAISELVDHDASTLSVHHLPSFVSLAVVEKSPISEHSLILHNPTSKSNQHHQPNKRPRLELDNNGSENSSTHEVHRLLPRPAAAQKAEKQNRPVPLLPAMVTGLHEPPPSAQLLPSMNTEDNRQSAVVAPQHALVERGKLSQTKPSSSKMQVKDILTESQQASSRRPPEAMVISPDPTPVDLPASVQLSPAASRKQKGQPQYQTSPPVLDVSLNPRSTNGGDTKTRRVRRKWSEQETTDLMAGVKKHGFGKWKQILLDPTYNFSERTSVDLKDRYRVSLKDQKPEEVPKKAVSRSKNSASVAVTPDKQSTTSRASPSLPSNEIIHHSTKVVTPSNTSPKRPLPPNSTDSQSPTITVSSPGQSLDSSVTDKSSKPRRKRHFWTPSEDASLIRGVRIHGFHWTAIHNDPDLELSHRRATDLRDHFRNLDPVAYNEAETRPSKLEMKTKLTFKGQESDSGVPSRKNNSGTDGASQIDVLAGEGPTTTTTKITRMTPLTANKSSKDSPNNKRQASAERATQQSANVVIVRDDQQFNHNLNPTSSTEKPTSSLSRIEKDGLLNPMIESVTPTNTITTATTRQDKNMTTASTAALVGTTKPSTTIKPIGDTSNILGQQPQQSNDHAAAGVTLPSIALDDCDDPDWADTTLPPILEWDEIGM